MKFNIIIIATIICFSGCIKEKLAITPPPTTIENKVSLNNTILVDFEYAKKTDKLVLLAKNPHKLYIFDYKTKQLDSLMLDALPNCIAISLDGNFAVIGFDYKILQVDILKKEIIKSFNTSITIGDIVYGINDDCFYAEKDIFGNSKRSIRSIRFKFGTEIEGSTDYFEIMRLKIHPSGKSIYAIDIENAGFGGQQKFRKFDISTSKANLTYTINSEANNIIDNFWISDDGNKIINRQLSIFSISSTINPDLNYIKNINMGRNISVMSLDQNINNQKIYFCSDNYFSSFESDAAIELDEATGEITKKYLFEPFNTDVDGFKRKMDACGFFVSLSSNNSKLIAVTKPFASNIYNQWGIEVIDIE